MTSITTRAGKGSPLTHNEVDANFTNLNNDKLDTAGIALGSAASPTLKFTGDLNTGIYSPGADQVAVATNGTGRLFVGSDGSVGVGTSALATVPLLLNDTGNGLVLQNAASGNYAIGLLAGTGSQDAYIYQRANAPLIIGTNNTERLRIDSSGRVGIGTASPSTYSANLAVFDGAGDGVVAIAQSTSSTRLQSNGQDFYINLKGTGSTVFRRGASDTESARIDSSGRVGIGTSTPSSQLDVRGSATNFDGIRIINTEGSSGVQTTTALRLGITNSIGIRNTRIEAVENAADSNDVHLDFYTNSTNALDAETVKLRITGAGDLQITDAGNITVGTTTGTKIGTATTQKLGFYNATPVVQPTAVADATDAATVITQLNALLTRMRNLGLIAT